MAGWWWSHAATREEEEEEAAAASRGLSPSPSPSSFHDLASVLVDFDPVKEWLVDPGCTALMAGEEEYSKGPCPTVIQPELQRQVSDSPIQQPELHQSRIPSGVHGLGSPIDEKMDKVTLVEGSEAMDGEKADGAHEICSVTDSMRAGNQSSEEETGEMESDGSEESDDSSLSETSSSSSSPISSEEEEEEEEEQGEKEMGEEEESKGKEMDGVVEIEEGEIRDCNKEEIIQCSDEEDEGPKGPIKSKHEVEVLPPVPQVEVFLEPHHQMIPAGVISSILGNRVIVEGCVKHNPLNEGSILWITETRSQLGLVDEIFGPVKNPYYVIRYNSDMEVPAGISVGMSASFVMEFANHILNEKDLYKKGYDASGDNDEEVNDETEFSDDDDEAEYRRSLRESKRATHVNQQAGTSKKRSNFNSKQPRQFPTYPPSAAAVGQPPPPLPSHPSHLQTPSASPNFGFGSCNFPHGPVNQSSTAQLMVPASPQACQMGNYSAGPGNPAASAPTPTVSIPQAFQMGNCSQGAGNPGATAPSMTVPTTPQAFQMGNFLLGAGIPGGSVPFPTIPANPQAFQMGNCAPGAANPGVGAPLGMAHAIPQAFQIGNCNFVDPSQPFNAVWAQGIQPQPQHHQMPLQGGGFPMNWLQTQQNLALNTLAAAIFSCQQQPQMQPQPQQFVLNAGVRPNMPWLSGPVNPNVMASPPVLVDPMGTGGQGQVPFGSSNVNVGPSNVNMQGTSSGSCGNQGHGQSPSPAAAAGHGGSGGTNPPSMQFTRGRSSFPGGRPYQRGGWPSFGSSRGGHR